MKLLNVLQGNKSNFGSYLFCQTEIICIFTEYNYLQLINISQAKIGFCIV